MGFSALRARAFALAIIPLSGAAQAAEHVDMPFDCRFDGVRVHMQPALDERTYAIVGPHEKQVFSTCSPDDPENCRSWLVHRFAFDCDGARVSWLEAAGAAARGENWDAWVEDGRFAMRMGRGWAVAPSRPFYHRRWRGRFAPDGEDPFGPGGFRDQTRIVTLPPGFAPALGIPLVFGGSTDAVAQAPAAPAVNIGPADRTPATQPASAANAIPDLPQRAPRAPAAPAAASSEIATAATPPFETTTSASATSAAAPAAATSVAAAQEVAPPARGDLKGPADNTAAATHAAFAPTIINEHGISGPGPAVAAPMPTKTAETERAKPGPASEAATKPQPPAQPEAAQTPHPVPVTDAAPSPPASSPPAETAALAERPSNSVLKLGASPLAAGAAATVLALSGLAAFGFWRRKRALAPSGARDIASITLDGERPRGPLALGNGGAAGPPGPTRTGFEAVNDFPVPKSYEEALKLLGTGPDASLPAIKKIVDGLRQNWHPDHATSESDRLYRERRLRQINVAWDLVSKRRTAA